VLLAFVLCEAVALVVHWPATRGFFQAEDFLWLRLATPQSVLQSFHGTWGHAVAYRPIMRVSYYLDWLLFGRSAFGWHLENIVLIGIDATLVAVLFFRLRSGDVLAVAAALLFVTGPVGRENVDWISGRTGLLALLFMMCAVLAWLRGSVAGAVIFTELGMATYEATAVLPAVLLLLTPVAASDETRDRRQLLRNVAAVAASTVVCLGLRAFLLGRAGAELDKMHHDLPTALRTNATGLLQALEWYWSLRALLLVTVAAVVSLSFRKTRSTALLLFGIAGLVYAPFAMLSGVALRFVFMMQLPLVGLLLLPLLLIEKGTVQAVVCVGVLAIVLPRFIAQSRKNAVEAVMAGDVARRIMEGAGEIAIADRKSNLVFACMPDSWLAFPLLAGNFRMAVDDWFGFSPGRVWNRDDVLRHPKEVLERLENEPTRLFRYFDGRFEEVHGTALANPIACN